MTQVIYAMGAMMLACLLAINVQQGIMRSKVRMVEAEVATQATGLAINRFEQIGALAFDGQGSVSSTQQLTPSSAFGGKSTFREAEAIEQVHGISEPDTLRIGVNPDEVLLYSMQASVQYLDAITLQPSTSQTYAKEVTLRISSSFLSAPLRVARVYTYQPNLNQQ